MMKTTTFTKWIPWIILLPVAGLYILTLDRGLRPDELTGGDLITHQYAQVQARFSNAPGYPLYVMLGWLWFRIGGALFGWLLNPVQILSLYSTIWGLASLWILYKLIYRPEVTQRSWILAALLTLFYAVTYFFWFYSVTTEQYTSAIFQTLLIVWFAFEWEAEAKQRTLLWLAFISGTMLANMLTTLFILPPLLYLVFTRRPDIFRRPKLIGQAVVAGLLPVAAYAFVYIRGAQHPEWRGSGNWLSTAEWFWQFISAQQGRDELAPGLILQNLITPEYPSLVWGELTWIVLIGGLIGLGLMGKRKAIFFYSTLLIYLFFATVYRFGNWFQVVLPMYPVIVLGFGRSLGWLWSLTSSPSREEGAKLWSRGFIILALIALIAYRLIASQNDLARIGKHNLAADTGLDPGWALLADVNEAGWELTAGFEEWLALQYLTEIWQAEPPITLHEPGTPAEFISRQALTAYPNLLARDTVRPQAVGKNLIRLQQESLANLPSQATPVKVPFGNNLSLLGYQLKENGALVLLYWQATAPLETNYTISTRLRQNGQLIQGETEPLIQDHQPVWNAYPTTRWRPGEIISDAYTFTLPPGAAPDQLQIVIYHPTAAGFENLGETIIDLK